MKKGRLGALHKFSDPYKDFQDQASSQLLIDICNKKYQDLNVFDYCVLFQPYCPPGNTSELFPYIFPLFSYIRNNIKKESTSAILSIWENFVDWYKNNKNEIINMGKIDLIEKEIENLFSYLIEFKWAPEMSYEIICSISGIIDYYICKLIEESMRAKKTKNIMHKLSPNEIKTKLIILELYLSAYKNIGKKNILDIYPKCYVRNIENELIEELLNWEKIPIPIEKLISEYDCIFWDSN